MTLRLVSRMGGSFSLREYSTRMESVEADACSRWEIEDAYRSFVDAFIIRLSSIVPRGQAKVSLILVCWNSG